MMLDSEEHGIRLKKADINSYEVLSIPDLDNDEKLVSMQHLIDNGDLILPSKVKTQVDDVKDSQTRFVREGILNKLQTAIKSLDEKYSLVLIEAYRSYEDQKELFDDKVKDLMQMDKSLSLEKAKEKARNYVSDPDVYSPHVTGGAIDVALLDKSTGDYIDMGNLFEQNESAAADYVGLTEDQSGNREILIDVMTRAGFINYHREWWHWSDGDKYSAYVRGVSLAKYGSTKLDSSS